MFEEGEILNIKNLENVLCVVWDDDKYYTIKNWQIAKYYDLVYNEVKVIKLNDIKPINIEETKIDKWKRKIMMNQTIKQNLNCVTHQSIIV